MLRFFTKCLPLLALATGLLAQSPQTPARPDYGEVSRQELEMNSYPADSTAEAVVLADVGRAYLQRDDVRGYVIIYERYVRIKILKSSGKDRANVLIPFYVGGNRSYENFTRLEGQTSRLVDGQVQRDELTKAAIFEEKQTTQRFIKRLSLPNVQVGSVLEYRYRMISDYVTQLRTWDFQNDIPTRWSEYNLALLPGFEYRILFQGFDPLALDTSEPTLSEGVRYRWAMKDLPTLGHEAHITTPDDYRARVWFELTRAVVDGRVQPFSNTWQALNATLLNDESFGLALNKNNFLNDLAAQIKAENPDTLAQAKAAYRAVQQHFIWNHYWGIYAENSLKTAFDKGTGSVPEINLTLVALLRGLGLKADPVVLSTRDHGRVSEEFPLLSRFNYVVAYTAVGGQAYTLDASDPLLPFGVLPVACLNGQGRLVARKPVWIPLTPGVRTVLVENGRFALHPDGNLTGSFGQSLLGYEALDRRHRLASEGREKFIKAHREALAKSVPDWDLGPTTLENAENTERELSIKDTMSVELTAANRLYISPFLVGRVAKNPFGPPERKFPVDFAYPFDHSASLTYYLPGNYTVESLPANLSLALPNNGGRFMCAFKEEDGKLLVSSRLSIRKAVFTAEEYASLREFYARIVQKHVEPVVLKKK